MVSTCICIGGNNTKRDTVVKDRAMLVVTVLMSTYAVAIVVAVIATVNSKVCNFVMENIHKLLLLLAIIFVGGLLYMMLDAIRGVVEDIKNERKIK